VKVHHVVHRAADLAARRPRLLESTMNRDAIRRGFEASRSAGVEPDWNPDSAMDDGNPLGEPESAITWQVDVSAYLEQRRQSMEAHRSQATDIEEFLGMAQEVFALAFGTEHYIEPGLDQPMTEGWPFGATEPD